MAQSATIPPNPSPRQENVQVESLTLCLTKNSKHIDHNLVEFNAVKIQFCIFTNQEHKVFSNMTFSYIGTNTHMFQFRISWSIEE